MEEADGVSALECGDDATWKLTSLVRPTWCWYGTHSFFSWNQPVKGIHIGSGHPKTKFSAQEFICPRGTKGREIRENGRTERTKQKRNRGEAGRYICPEGLPLDREVMEMVIYDGEINPLLRCGVYF